MLRLRRYVSNMISQNRFILCIAVLVGLAAALLGGLAFSLSRHELKYQRQTERDYLEQECRLLANRLHNELDNIRQALTGQLRDIGFDDPEKLSRFVEREPLAINAFRLQGDRLLQPAPDSRFHRRFAPLFEEFVSARQPEALPEAEAPDRESFLPEPPAFAAPLLVCRFQSLSAGKNAGWLNWFADNEFRPLLYCRNPQNPEQLIGLELNFIVLLSRLLPLLPSELPGGHRLELTEPNGNLLAAFGAPADRTLPPQIGIPVSSELLPGVQLNGRLRQEQFAGGFVSLLLLQLASLLLVIVAGGGLLIYLVRRQLQLAGQKTSFVANVSHELKTPLTSIRIYAEMLHDHGDRLPPPKQAHYLEIILAESERLSRLIANVLDFSKLEVNKKQYHPQDVQLQEFLARLAADWQPQLTARALELRLALPEQPLRAFIDADALQQVLQNLLSNALKYADGGGRLDLTLLDAEHAAEIRLRDYGPGIPPAARRKVFRKFYRCDNRLTAKCAGSGLGLTIARKLLRDQHGDLRLEPETPGVAFRIVLPKSEAKVKDELSD